MQSTTVHGRFAGLTKQIKIRYGIPERRYNEAVAGLLGLIRCLQYGKGSLLMNFYVLQG